MGELSAVPHTRPDYYLSRVVHIVTGCLLFSSACAPYIYKEQPEFIAKWIPIGAVALSLFSGLYNAGAARPSRWGGGAKRYRVLVYGAKISLILMCTPLTQKFFPSEIANGIQLGAVSSLVLIGSYLRFYREENNKMLLLEEKKK
eukprot:CAMPEP_0201520936 /NCGR_PEP_ID=MMETSP0161_2-20130828/13435_1 /ASSEMBLY_ACC=CAM_ASM_000251 /TAXON_ID=180227 /ORGANISM="Neoparamoeba aestuarina, Strain SoJaBio B1-5/56/2" /LENGTH=144 /DNA_ID=CAMNT_0047919469 /DNA_START=13 /DNA_END=447 /DNA_ORIENTATION=+